MIRFSVPGKPQGKGRAKTVRLKNGASHTFTPEKTVLYENLILAEYMRAAGEKRFKDKQALSLCVNAYYAIPKSASKSTRKKMLSGEIRPTVRPDLDNIQKAVMDALNKVSYRDDAQIVDLEGHKYYADRPRVEIAIFDAGREGR